MFSSYFCLPKSACPFARCEFTIEGVHKSLGSVNGCVAFFAVVIGAMSWPRERQVLAGLAVVVAIGVAAFLVARPAKDARSRSQAQVRGATAARAM